MGCFFGFPFQQIEGVKEQFHCPPGWMVSFDPSKVLQRYTLHPRAKENGPRGIVVVNLVMVSEEKLAWFVEDEYNQTSYCIEVLTDFVNLENTKVKLGTAVLQDPFAAFSINDLSFQVQLMCAKLRRPANLYLLSINQSQLQFLDPLLPSERMKSLEEHSLP
jgi:hypothetical protein